MVKRKSKKAVKKKINSPKVPLKNKDTRTLWNGWQAVPLKGSFMIFAILGFLITAYMIYPIEKNFGIALMLIFTAMFFASIVSITKAPLT